MIGFTLSGIDTGLALALTYLLHSTFWIAVARLLMRHQPALAPCARQLVWRATLFGPLASSVLGLVLDQRSGWVPLDAALALWSPAPLPSVVLRPLAPLGLPEFAAPTLEPFTPTPESPAFSLGSLAFSACWAAISLVCIGLLARALWRQRRALRRRRPVTDVVTLRALERLRERAGMRHPILLTRCAAASRPMVLSQHEICLPERSRELGREAIEAVLAHELAHIERRDGIWLYATLLLQAVFWFQPCNRKISAELMASTELAADDRAVELTGDGLGLARTLTQVAGWAGCDVPGPSLAMAHAGSPIVQRVARLVAASEGSAPLAPRRGPGLALAALATIGACSPSIGAPRTLLQAIDPGALSLAVAPAHPYPIWESPRGLPTALATQVLASPEFAPRAARVARRARAAERVVAEAPPTRVASRRADRLEFPLPPVEAMVSDVLSQVMPRAMAFSQASMNLAFSESRLLQRTARLERALAEGRVAVAPARAELARLSRDVAQLTARRRSLEQQFQTQMRAFGERLEARFAVNVAPRRSAAHEGLGL